MKNVFTILGSGSSLGSPWINNYWGRSDKDKPKNHRTRCCAHLKFKNLSILIDTSPDIKKQLIDNKIKDIDAVMYTHEHTDQTSGIFELRPFFWKNKKKIDIFANKRVLSELIKKYTFCFYKRHGYQPIMKANRIKKSFLIKKDKDILKINSFRVRHGLINSTAYVFNKIAYISDCNKIPSENIDKLKSLNYLIVDCLREKKHPSHFNLKDALNLIKKIKPKKSILTNLHVDFDYYRLKKKLPKNVYPAYDGLKINF